MTTPTRVVIRKYGNRRLYDSSSSRYINLEELAALVREGRDVQVVDARTGEDLTGVTLTQIIVEDARQQPQGYPLELLRQVIVASNHAGREFLNWYLKSAVTAYHTVQDTLKAALPASPSISPLDMVRGAVAHYAGDSESSEIAELKRRIAGLEARSKPRGKARKKKVKTRPRGPAGKRSSGKPRR